MYCGFTFPQNRLTTAVMIPTSESYQQEVDSKLTCITSVVPPVEYAADTRVRAGRHVTAWSSF